MKRYDIIIIGAGAAGMMAAAGASAQGCRTVILEKMARPGRKIMITGKGRCNYTNLKPWNEFQAHIHPKANFLKPSYFTLNPEKLMDFMSTNGMESVTERGDRVFPSSHLAADVVDTLAAAVTKAGAEIICNKEVTEISYVMNDETPDGTDMEFSVKCTDASIYSCRRLIVCTGGLSYPQTGSTGDGYRWAEAFGHSIRPLFPSLTAIVPSGYKTESSIPASCHIERNTPLSESGNCLCGNHLKNVSLKIVIDGNEAAREFGDLDFTDGGIEGPIGFKVSRKCVNALINGSKVTAFIDLKPAVEQEDLEKRIRALWDELCKDKKHGSKSYKDRYKVLLNKLMPVSLVSAFCRLNPNTDHKTLSRTLKNWKFEISGYVGYERCVITAGGVSCEEINQKTLESRLNSGLYFAGEVLDLDADTGGYNLQTAFCTGYLAGISAARSFK